jgi:hypothetical protein
MKNFRNRAAEKARRAASGGDGPPAGRDTPTSTPAVADRGAMRKRLRHARRTRDLLLHELGALVMEMHRQGRHDADLVARKAQEAIAVDAEARALAGTLDEPLTNVTAPPPAPAPVAPPPAPGDRVSAPSADGVPGPPPAASARVDAPPPAASDRVDTPASGDGVPTHTVTVR